jgi:hypothetical protein
LRTSEFESKRRRRRHQRDSDDQLALSLVILAARPNGKRVHRRGWQLACGRPLLLTSCVRVCVLARRTPFLDRHDDDSGSQPIEKHIKADRVMVVEPSLSRHLSFHPPMTRGRPAGRRVCGCRPASQNERAHHDPLLGAAPGQ